MEGGTVIRMRKERKYRPLVGPKKKKEKEKANKSMVLLLFFLS